jgi:hypothetical protein
MGIKHRLHYAGDFDAKTLSPVAEGASFRDLVELQAADFLAWEWRKSHEDRKEWWQKPDKPTDWNERWADFEDWMEHEKPRTRKSILALLERAQFTGFIWDYDRLCEAHERRGGVWSINSSS